MASIHSSFVFAQSPISIQFLWINVCGYCKYCGVRVGLKTPETWANFPTFSAFIINQIIIFLAKDYNQMHLVTSRLLFRIRGGLIPAIPDQIHTIISDLIMAFLAFSVRSSGSCPYLEMALPCISIHSIPSHPIHRHPSQSLAHSMQQALNNLIPKKESDFSMFPCHQ